MSLQPDHLDLKKIVLAKECVAFVGAGISIPPGKDWTETVRSLAKHCGVPLDDKSSLPEIIDTCIEKDRLGCNKLLQSIFPRHVAAARTAMGYLLRLPFKAILTTNFDPYLRQQSQQNNFTRCHIYPDLPLHTGLKDGIYYLHGYFDSENEDSNISDLVFGDRSFCEAYGASLLAGVLLNTFTYENVMFLGFNPTEKNIARLLSDSIGVRQKIDPAGRATRPKRFVLWPEPAAASPEEKAREDAIISQIRSLEVTPVLYDRLAPDYRGIEQVLLSWIEEGELKSRPAPFLSGFDISR